MRTFLLRLIVNAAALAATAALLPGIHTSNNEIGTLIVIAFIFGILNAIIKPVLVIMSCPLIILTLGLFTLVINGVLLLATDALAGNRFTVDSIGWAILGGMVMGFISGILESVLGVNEKDDDRDDDRIIFSR